MKKRIVIIGLILMMLSLVACQTENNPINEVINQSLSEPEEVVEIIEEYGDFGGYLWEVTNGEATVYLFGSIHMAKEGLYPFNEVVESAFASADVLGVEADISDTAAVMSAAPLMRYEKDDSVYNHLTEEGIKKFEDACKELKLDPKYHSQFKSWVVGSNILSFQLMKSDYSAKYGVDMYFLNKANALGKDKIALEGIQYQMNLINAFTDLEAEEVFFAFGTIQETIDEFTELYEFYLSGDVDQMTAFLFEEGNELTSNESIEDKMLSDRNVGMAEKIDGYLQTDKTYFVVVGLAHYLGDESVIKYLEDKGYTVKRK